MSKREVSSKNMLAVLKSRPGKGFELMEWPVPTELSYGEILVKVQATSICGSDIHLYEWDEWSAQNVFPPLIVGHEAGGIVVGKGPGVKLNIGVHVALETHVWCGECVSCRKGDFHVCKNLKVLGFDINGTFAEFVKVPAQNAIKLPSGLPWEVVPLLEPFGNAVEVVSKVSLMGKTVLITGMGPIGLMGLKLVLAGGASKVIVSEPSNKRRKIATNIGADYVIDPSSEDLVQAVQSITDGEGVDVYLEFSGAIEALNAGLKSLVPGGDAVLLGLYGKNVSINLDDDVILKGINLYGVTGRKIYSTWEKALSLAVRNKDFLASLITHKFDLQDFEKGIDLLRKKEAIKVVLFPP